jgi:hypothetical protein
MDRPEYMTQNELGGIGIIKAGSVLGADWFLFGPPLCLEMAQIILLAVIRLTKQEQLVLCISLGLLLTGWAVKAYRTAHPPAVPRIEIKP